MTLSSLNVNGRKAISWVNVEPNGVLRGSSRVSRMFRVQPDKSGAKKRRFRDKIASSEYLKLWPCPFREIAPLSSKTSSPWTAPWSIKTWKSKEETFILTPFWTNARTTQRRLRRPRHCSTSIKSFSVNRIANLNSHDEDELQKRLFIFAWPNCFERKFMIAITSIKAEWPFEWCSKRNAKLDPL